MTHVGLYPLGNTALGRWTGRPTVAPAPKPAEDARPRDRVVYDPRYKDDARGFSGNVVLVAPTPYTGSIPRDNRIISQLHKRWDAGEFAQTRQPVPVGTIENKGVFSAPIPGDKDRRYTIVIMRRKGEKDFRLPVELKQLAEPISKMMGYDRAVHRNVDTQEDVFFILSQSVVDKDQKQLFGTHVDQFGSLNSIRTYVVSDKVPTAYYRMPFKVGDDELSKIARFDYSDFRGQTQEDKIWRPDPYQIVLHDQYTVHRSDTAKERCFRTFLGLAFMTASKPAEDALKDLTG